MPIEGPIVDLSSLNENWPLDNEIQRDAGPPHIQLTKDAYKKTFTGLVSGGGVVNASAAELNYLTGIQGNVQTLIDEDDTPPRTVDTALTAVANDKLLCNPPPVGMSVGLPEAPPDGTEVRIHDVSGLAAPLNNEITLERTGTSDTITWLTTKQENLTQLTFVFNSMAKIAVYFSGVWYVWELTQQNINTS